MKSLREQELTAQLRAVGVSKLGLRATHIHKQLAQILDSDEKIGGAVYGNPSDGVSWLVATDRRVIFVDSMPLFSTTDEITYDVVSGVMLTKAGFSSGVTLHTRVHDYIIRFAPNKCASQFVQYIEKRRLETDEPTPGAHRSPTNHTKPVVAQNSISPTAVSFLRNHSQAILSTVNRTGLVEASVVRYLIDQNNTIYLIAKATSSKGRNIFTHHQVVLTVNPPDTQQAVYIEGWAEIETDPTVREGIFRQTRQLLINMGEIDVLPEGVNQRDYITIKINPTNATIHTAW